MAEPNINEPTEPERSETETDASSTSSGDGQDVGPPDSHDTPVVYVEPPLTQAHPPIFYIPIPSPGDPVPLIPTKAFVVGPVEPIPAKPKSVFLSDYAIQSTSVDQQTGPNQATQQVSGSAQDQTDSDVEIPTIPARSPNDDVDIPVLTRQPVIGKPVPVPPKPRGVAKSCFDVDSKTPVPAPGRVIWSSTDIVVPRSVFMTGHMAPLNTFPHVAFGEFSSAVPGSAPKSHSGWTSCGAQAIPMATPPPSTGWFAPGIPNPPPPPLHQPAVHVPPPIGTPTPISGKGSGQGSPFQTPSSVHLTTPRVIPEPQSTDVQFELQPRVLFPNPTNQPDANMTLTGPDPQQTQRTQPTATPDSQQTQVFDEKTGVRHFTHRGSTSASSSHQPVVPDVSQTTVDQGPAAPSGSDAPVEQAQSDDSVFKHLHGAHTNPEFNSMMSNIQTAVIGQTGQDRGTQTDNQEPEDEPQVPPIRVPVAWDKMEGSIILIGGFSNAGKSSLVEDITSAFGLKRWTGHPNRKVWISNETGQERNSMRHLLHYTNDSFRIGNEINHLGLNQSIDTMTAKFKHWVTFVEGHRILDNEDLVNKAALFIWIHTPSQTRKVRSPSSKSKSMEEWNVQLQEEIAYFNRNKNVFQRLPFTILDGLQTKAFNAMVVMAIMGLFSKKLERNRLVCYREFEMPNPEDTDADNQRLQAHSKHDPKQFSTIFRSKIFALRD